MNKFKQLAVIYPVTVMFVICLVITAALAGTNSITHNRIEEINEKNEKAAMERLIKADEYEKREVEFDGQTYEYSAAKTDDEINGFIFKINEKGYGGIVSVMVAIKTDGTVGAVELLDVSNETPGLGQNTARPGFTKQFEGKSDKNGELSAVKHGTKRDDSQIDAVASATITSRAVTRAVNKAINLMDAVMDNYKSSYYDPDDAAADADITDY